MNEAIWTQAKIVADLLARGAYDEVVAMTRGERLTAGEIGRAVSDHGRNLAPLPDDAEPTLDVVEIEGSDPPRYSVIVPLWTLEEGRSDLSLELELTEIAPTAYSTALLDIHVL
jgi:hypothetical protein